MKFIAIALLASMASAAVVPSTLRAREDWSVECLEAEKHVGFYGFGGGFSLACEGLASNCLTEVQNTSDIWGLRSCVAAATCSGAGMIHFLANCTSTEIAHNLADTPSLSYNLYAEIVGDCAWAPGGCPLSFQNFVNFVYGSLSAINSEFWPDSVDQVKTDWWTPITTWTAKPSTIPYLNFNDWLHFSSSL
ncbi:hypothetical protein C8J56DRAFT_334602 [Mycena floridula]|nr:hypothetical protein C8J56DRAFT_334602 [Mycena floridula]